MAIDPKLIDELLAEHGKRPGDIAGKNGLLKQLTKAILERALQAELTEMPTNRPSETIVRCYKPAYRY